MSDFVAEMTTHEPPAGGKHKWAIFIYGASSSTGSRAGILLENKEGIMIEHSLSLSFPTSNNQDEYEALLIGLRLAEDLGAREVQVFTDSQLVTSQVRGEYQAKNDSLIEYLNLVKERMKKFDRAKIKHVPREHNTQANIFSKLVSIKKKGGNKSVIQESISRPSIIKSTLSAEVNTIGDK